MPSTVCGCFWNVLWIIVFRRYVFVLRMLLQIVIVKVVHSTIEFGDVLDNRIDVFGVYVLTVLCSICISKSDRVSVLLLRDRVVVLQAESSTELMVFTCSVKGYLRSDRHIVKYGCHVRNSALRCTPSAKSVQNSVKSSGPCILVRHNIHSHIMESVIESCRLPCKEVCDLLVLRSAESEKNKRRCVLAVYVHAVITVRLDNFDAVSNLTSFLARCDDCESVSVAGLIHGLFERFPGSRIRITPFNSVCRFLEHFL